MEKDCQARKLNREHAVVDGGSCSSRWRKLIKDV